MNNQIQIHATNVEGLGAKNVVKSLIATIDKEYPNKVHYVYLNSNDYNVSNLKIANTQINTYNDLTNLLLSKKPQESPVNIQFDTVQSKTITGDHLNITMATQS